MPKIDKTEYEENQGFFRSLLRLIKVTMTLIITFLLLGVVSIMGAYFYFARDLPNIQTMADYKPPIVSEVFATDGTKIGEFWRERRLTIPLDDMPKQMVQAFIASEDARFFEHQGVDLLGIGRAVWEDLKAGGFVQGASTITQQITRSILLSRERKIGRKIREAILATRLERNLNKRQILDLYLNQIYLGNRAYGVRAAAENYFHKGLNELNLGEITMIAGLSRAPSVDTPVKNVKKAKTRQRHVLERMVGQGFLTRDEQRRALVQPLTVYKAQTDKEFNIRYTPYFTEHVRRMLLERYGEKVLYEGGLRIESTVDIEKYRAAEEALRWGLEALDHRQGYRGALQTGLVGPAASALGEEVHQAAIKESGDLVIHIPETEADHQQSQARTPLVANRNYRAVVTGMQGSDYQVLVGHNHGVMPNKLNWSRRRFHVGDVIEVKTTENEDLYALVQTPKVQGALFSMEVKTGFVRAMIGGYDYRYSEFNRATQALRQPGSSFKPFVYSAALDKGFTYSTPVADTPVAYRDGRKIWAPKNYGGKFSGVGAFASHITYSRNVPTVKIGHVIGFHYMTGFCRKLGLTSPIGKYLSMSLGANGVYVNEIVNAYATFGNHGKKPPQVYITKITDAHGAIVAEEVAAEAVKNAEDGDESAEKTQVIKLVDADIAPHDLNQELWETNKHWIDDDELNLDPQEVQVLYGSRIPDGYVLTPQTAYLTIGLLQKVVQSGTGRRVAALGRPVGGKTGTTNNETDTWFVGLTPQLAAGVWVGFDEVRRLGRGEQGGRTAAPIFLRYMKEAMKDMPIEKFEPPEGFPVGKMASLPGGSAAYWSGGTRSLSEEIKSLATRRMDDRAGDFFEADISDF